MESKYLWTILISLSIGTFLLRASIIYLYSFLKISPKLKEVLGYIPAAVLPAIAAPSIFLHQGSVDILIGKERLVAALIASIIAYKTKNVFYTLLVGMSLLYIMTTTL